MTLVTRDSRSLTQNIRGSAAAPLPPARSGRVHAQTSLSCFFDSQIFSIQKFGGISNYFVNIIKELGDLGHLCQLPFRHTVNYHLNDFDRSFEVFNCSNDISRKALLFRNSIIDFVHALKRNYDVVHSTHYLVPHYYFLRHVKNHIVTVHDMIPEIMPEQFKHNPHYRKRDYVTAAAAVICPSQQTKQDLIRLYGLDNIGIFVVPHGVDRAAWQHEEPVDTAGDFILFVGKREYYKNFPTLLDAAAELTRRGRAINLFCAGGGAFTPSEMHKIEALGLAHHVRQRDVTRAELAWLYGHARATVMPSLGEGFGLPVLEAMVKNCSVVLSDIGCFREIADDHAVYVDPNSSASIAEGIERVLVEAVDKQAYASICDRFTWQAAAAGTANVYRHVLNQRA